MIIRVLTLHYCVTACETADHCQSINNDVLTTYYIPGTVPEEKETSLALKELIFHPTMITITS